MVNLECGSYPDCTSPLGMPPVVDSISIPRGGALRVYPPAQHVYVNQIDRVEAPDNFTYDRHLDGIEGVIWDGTAFPTLTPGLWANMHGDVDPVTVPHPNSDPPLLSHQGGTIRRCSRSFVAYAIHNLTQSIHIRGTNWTRPATCQYDGSIMCVTCVVPPSTQSPTIAFLQSPAIPALLQWDTIPPVLDSVAPPDNVRVSVNGTDRGGRLIIQGSNFGPAPVDDHVVPYSLPVVRIGKIPCLDL